MGKISEMTVDELAQVITPEFLEESAQIIKKDLAVMPFQVLQDQTAKYITILPGIRNQITFGELDGDAQLRPFKHDVRKDADYNIVGRTLEVFPGNCAEDFDPMPLFHSIWGESIAMGEAISKGMIAKKLLALFAAKIGMHLNDVVFVGGVRNVSGTTTADLFDSFDTIIGKEITAGTIAAGKGNYIKLGDIDATNAVEKLKEFYRAADKMLKGRPVLMYISPEVYDAYCDDYQARHGALPYNTSFDKVYLEGSRGRCEFAILDNMAGSKYLKISIKQNFLLGTDIMYQQNTPFIRSYAPWTVTFAYAGVYGEQIRCINKEFLMIGDLSQSPEPGPTPGKQDVTITFAKGTDTATVGTEYAGQVASITPSGKTLTYSSSDTSVAEVNASTGAVTIKKAGTAVITAAFAGDDEYKAGSASYTLVVAKGDAEVAFTNAVVNATTTDTGVGQTASVLPEGKTLSYASSDENVATVDEATGAVTIVAVGTALITATFAGDDGWKAADASYALVITQGE